MVANVRTIVVTMSPMLRDIITDLVADYVTLDIVADFDSRTEVVRKSELLAPDLVFVGLHIGEADDIGRDLLAHVPAAKIIAISCDGRTAYIHEMRACRTVLPDVSSQVLTDAIIGTPVRT